MKWDGPDLLVVRCSSFAARKGKRGKGDELRKGKDSSLFLCSKILTTSFFRQLPSPPWKQQRELRPCIEYDGAARRWLHRGRYRGIVSLLFRAWLRSGYRLLHVARIRLATFLPLPVSSALAQLTWRVFALAYRLIHTIRYFFSARDGWTHLLRAIYSSMMTPSSMAWQASFRRALSFVVSPPPGNTTCFDALISLNSSAGPDRHERGKKDFDFWSKVRESDDIFLFSVSFPRYLHMYIFYFNCIWIKTWFYDVIIV